MDLRPLWLGGGALFLIFVGLLVGALYAVNRQRSAHLAGVRRWARRLLSAQDDAAASLARELHDDLVQQLNVLAWQVEPPALKAELDGIIGQLRGIAHGLHPASVDEQPLEQVLKRLAEEQDVFSPPTVSLVVDGTLPPLPVPVRRNLYRIAQQAVANAQAHAHAEAVVITLETKVSWVLLSVRDDGRGFDPAGATPAGLGLRSMEERAASIGASLHLESAVGKGTLIRVAWPVG